MKSKNLFQDSGALSLSGSCNDPFILFVFWPFVKTIQLSFARTTPLGQVAQYVGLDNYTNIFTDGTFLNSLVTTLKFSVMRVILSIVIGFILAIISTEKIRRRDFSVLYMHFRWLFRSSGICSVHVYFPQLSGYPEQGSRNSYRMADR